MLVLGAMHFFNMGAIAHFGRKVRAVICRAMTYQVHIIGGGLAGSEAAWQLAEAGVQVRLSEMRGSGDMTPAHQTDGLAELVCSNSNLFRSDDAEHNAVGLLHAEMRALGSLIMRAADAHRVPAGSALAVDRDGFSAGVTARARRRIPISSSSASGSTPCPTRPDDHRHRPAHRRARSPRRSAPRPAPTRSPSSMRSRRSSIATASTWTSPGCQSRWDKGDAKDYINCPMTKDQYLAFHQGLIDGEKTEFRSGRRTRPISRAACRSR